MIRRCEGCSGEDAVMTYCVNCARQMCHRCVSCARQCAECAAKREIPTIICSLCKKRGEELRRCVICQTAVCKNCILYKYLSRPKTIICIQCQIPPPLTLRCNRCGGIIREENLLYYCEVCGNPLCDNCLTSSLECGLLKCRTCCPAPVRLLNDKVNRTILDDEVKSKIYPVETVKSISKYRNLRRCEKLGEGGQGVVFKCATLDGEIVVSKEMKFNPNDRIFFNARLKQAEKMRKLSHKHLIRYLDVIGSEKPLKISVIMPYYSEGDLFKFIKRQRGPIEEHKLCSIILQIASALDYLHSQSPPLAHCDIKPENILLLNREEQVLLMDLDLCHSCDTQPSATSRVLTERHDNSPTFEYRAPEMANSTGSVKSDVFSLGVVAFVLATLPEFAMLRNNKGSTTVLSDSDWTRQSLAQAVRGAIYKHTTQYSEALINLIIKMLLHQPSERPGAREVMEELTQAMEERLLQAS